ncbi:MAG: aspartate 1-decarboxylase [Dehalococcoidia bacterium]|nr:aspartate 1-decarboxylase [Dehalococcoidia bacterium]
MRIMLKGKIHRARITETNVDYEGSITIDSELMEAADVIPYEQVQVLDVNNSARFETYAIAGEKGSGKICVNGAAARLVAKGDTVIILTYSHMSDEQARTYHPKLVYVDSRNRNKHKETTRESSEALIASLKREPA